MPMNHCKFNLDNINLTRKDIVISIRVPYKYFQGEIKQHMDIAILKQMACHNNQLGDIDRKLHYDPKADTQIMFLQFCNTDVHEDVIKELNVMEWPKSTKHYLYFRFNSIYTLSHQARNREKLQYHNIAVKQSNSEN